MNSRLMLKVVSYIRVSEEKGEGKGEGKGKGKGKGRGRVCNQTPYRKCLGGDT